MNIEQRVEKLRRWMQSQGIEAYVIPTADPHNNEYIPAHWMCREWITGFTGSAGLAVVTLQSAALWTDSRYWLQAAEQLKDTPFELMREGDTQVPSPNCWIIQQLKSEQEDMPQAHCPADMLTPQMQADALAAGLHLLPADDAFNVLWTNRPDLPKAPIEIQNIAYTGRSTAEKLKLAAELLNSILDGKPYVFNDLSDIAWLLNLRGNDIPYNPVFVSYLVYNPLLKEFTLFTHHKSLTAEALEQLSQTGVKLQEYQQLLTALGNEPVALDFATASCLLHRSERDSDIPSPIATLRAHKNAAEQEGFRKAMLHDGVAMVRFLHWLDAEMEAGKPLSECSVETRLAEFRAEQPGFKDLSFATIAAYGPHAAIVHYEATPETDVPLEPHGMLLLDSGAQFDCGTTDITRTIALGTLTDEEKRVYTLVLKGHLRLSRMRFPEQTTGLQLDTAARYDMWAAGYDFGHGTGHGVGSHLCVHEGPHQIRKNVRSCTLIPFTEGMVVTNEPGIYAAGKFGVRIENVLLCVPDRTTDFGNFMRFEDLTLCPYDMRPVDRKMLTDEEVKQINDYHASVKQHIMPLLNDPSDREWLEMATQPLV